MVLNRTYIMYTSPTVHIISNIYNYMGMRDMHSQTHKMCVQFLLCVYYIKNPHTCLAMNYLLTNNQVCAKVSTAAARQHHVNKGNIY